MKRVAIIVAVLALAAVALHFGRQRGGGVRPATSAANAPAAAAKATPPPDGLRVERDPKVVFERALWRRPGDDVRILNGERREWFEGGSVRKWQWFLALETTPEFRKWLLEQNPFELARADGPTSFARPPECPDWFPASENLAPLTFYRVRGSGLAVFLDATSGRMFATDSGGGFAAAVR